MRKDSLVIAITTVLAVGVSFFSFTLALAYLQIPKEIPTPTEIEIPKEVEIETYKEITEKSKESHKIQDTQAIKKAVEQEMEKTEVTKKTLTYYSRLIEKKSWKGTGTPKIAIILDDAGYNINGTVKQFLQLEIPLTFSVIPGLKYSKEIAQMAHEKRFEVMVHIPMENWGNSRMTEEDKLCKANHKRNPYKYFLSTGMSKEEVEKNFDEAINNIPYASGINNHMGSKATTDEVIMSYFLDKVKEKNFYFIDSLTSSKSVAYKVAKRKQVRSNKRSVFLDNINDPKYVKERLSELIYMAKRNGYAIGIGHITKSATAKGLAEMVPKLKEYGIEVVPVSQLVN